jgi:hypothetical protein
MRHGGRKVAPRHGNRREPGVAARLSEEEIEAEIMAVRAERNREMKSE